MQKLYLSPTSTTPEIHFSPEANIFLIKGHSSPEDVRALYYPVVEWITEFCGRLTAGKNKLFSHSNPLIFKADLDYFNSSSAKFLYDIFVELKKAAEAGIPIRIEWHYDEEDVDLLEAGTDIAVLVDMEFSYIPK